MGLAEKLAKKGIVSDEPSEVTAFLSTGYKPLDYEISGHYHNGGIPQGRMTEIAGYEATGKTALAVAIMKSAQEQGGFAMFKDHENAFDVGLAKSQGLSDDPNKFLYNTPNTFEESVDKASEYGLMVREELGPDVPIVAVFDSLASMVPKSKWDKNAADYNMNDTTALARATSAAFPVMSLLAMRSNITMVFLNQVRTKPGVMYGSPDTTPGGQSMAFYASLRIKLAKIKHSDKDFKAKDGHGVKASIDKNKVWKPHGEARWDFYYSEDGTGHFDVAGGSVDALIELGIIEQGGAYVTFEGDKMFKSQFVKKMRADPAFMAHVISKFPA